MRVVFDTNIFVSAFAMPGGAADRALHRVIAGQDVLFISHAILSELTRVLSQKFGHEPEQLARTAVFLAEAGELVRPRARIRVLADEPDNRILECAIAARADAVVTGDRAMLALKSYRDIEILSLKTYLDGPGGAV